MIQQKSFEKTQPTLYLVATPIGNLSDISLRAIEMLKSVDLIFAEDTRTSKVLLHHYAIDTPCQSYHEHNKDHKEKVILAFLNEGKNVAIISDAGMPVISDPGYEIVLACIQEDIPVVVIPGANAALSALVTSGLPPSPFTYYGFLSSTQSKWKNELDTLKHHPYTLIFYETPHRIKACLENMLDIFGDREIALAREITKKFEEIMRGRISDILPLLEHIKGEIVIVVSAMKAAVDFSHMTVIDHVKLHIDAGIAEKEAIKEVANLRQMKKQDVYLQYHSDKQKML